MSVLHGGLEAEVVVRAVVVVVVAVGVEVRVGAGEVEAGGLVGVVLVADGALQVFDETVVLRSALFVFLEITYNRQRRRSSLGYRNPTEFNTEARAKLTNVH